MQLGLEKLAAKPAILAGRRFGLLMNRASVDAQLQLACDVLATRCRDQFRAILTPQHGLWGDAQANMIETPHGRHDGYDLRVYSLYSETRRPTDEMLAELDCLVVDLQDVGTRVYTYAWTLLECLRACEAKNIAVLVLDRPNPIGGLAVEGALLNWDYASFVGGANIPMRHALTLGEIARLLKVELRIDVDLEVVPAEGWRREARFPTWKRTWIPPSPNLPRFEAALTYPGQVLWEGTNVSEGRGTTTPFEIVGAPFIEPEVLWQTLADLQLPGVTFLPLRFRPSFDKWSGQSCGGVSLHVTDPEAFRPYRTAVAMMVAIRSLWPADFEWLPPPYEYERQKMPIDIIAGSDALRVAIDRLPDLPAANAPARRDLRECLAADPFPDLWEVDVQAWQERTRAIRCY